MWGKSAVQTVVKWLLNDNADSAKICWKKIGWENCLFFQHIQSIRYVYTF